MSGPNETRSSGDRAERPIRTRRVVYIVLAVLCLFLVLFALGVIPRIVSHRQLAAAAKEMQQSIRKVYVIRPVPADVSELVLAATTQAIPDAIVYARTSGYVAKRYVDIGDRVKAGQLLAEIESPEIEQQLRQALADLQQSERNLELQKANLNLARVTMERYQGADAEGAVAKQALDQSIAGFRTADAAFAAAQANTESNRANVQRLRELTGFQRVLAPFDGTVIQRNVDVGALITAGSPVNNISVAPTSVTGGANGLFEVARIESLRVFVSIPQAFALNVRPGMAVQVEVRGQLMEPVGARVSRTSVGLDPGTRTLLTQVDIPNTSHRLLPGMFVYVRFKLPPAGTRWRIPSTAVIFDAKGTRVVVVRADNRLHFQDVQVGRDFGAFLDIQAGLNGNELIVKQPSVSLEEGQVVQPAEPPEHS